MILRFEMREVRNLLVAYLEKRPQAAEREVLQVPVDIPETPEPPRAAEPAPPEVPAAEQPGDAPEPESAPEIPDEPGRDAPSREKTEQAVAALCQEALGEGILCMGLKAHLDPLFIVETYAEVLGCSDRDARSAFQAYVRKHPSPKAEP